MSGFANYDTSDPDRSWHNQSNSEEYHQTWYHCPDCGTVMFVNTTCYYCAAQDWQKESPLEAGDRIRLIAMLRVALGYLPRIEEKSNED